MEFFILLGSLTRSSSRTARGQPYSVVDYVAAGLVYCLSCLCPFRTVVAVVKLLVREVCVVVVVVVGDFGVILLVMQRADDSAILKLLSLSFFFLPA